MTRTIRICVRTDHASPYIQCAGPGGPYPPEFYPPADELFPGPPSFPPRPFRGVPYGPQGGPYGPEDMYFNGPVDPTWGPPFAGRGGGPCLTLRYCLLGLPLSK